MPQVGSTEAVANQARRQLVQNVTANYLSVLWIGGLTLALIPWYTRLLDSHQWGLVAVCMSLQGIMTLLDAGLTQIMPRDVARVIQNKAALAKTYYLFARSYTALALLGFTIGQFAAPLIAEHWLHTEKEQVTEATVALRIILVQFLFQFINNANTGYWNGTQDQLKANIRQSVFATAKHATALLSIVMWEASSLTYLISFATVSALEYIGNRYSVERQLAAFGKQRILLGDYKKLGREVSMLGTGVLIGMLLSQLDRLLLTGAVDMASFGRYVVVSNLGLAFMQLQVPLVRAFLPRIASANAQSVRKGTRQLGLAILVMCVLPCTAAAAAAPRLLELWIGDARIVGEGTFPLRLILAAVALNGIYQILYQQMLLRGMASVILKINLLIFFIVAPFAAFAVKHYGIAGGGMTWLSVSTLQLAVGFLFLKKSES